MKQVQLREEGCYWFFLHLLRKLFGTHSSEYGDRKLSDISDDRVRGKIVLTLPGLLQDKSGQLLGRNLAAGISDAPIIASV